MKKYIILGIVFAFSAIFAAGSSAGKTGLSFLKVGVDARAVGMGEAYTALAGDASATFWNPAGLLRAKNSNVIFNHNEWVQDIQGEFAAISFVGKKSAWGFHVRSFNIGDIPVRVIASEYPLEQTSAHYASAGVSYARKITPAINFGITGKYLFEKIYVESANGYALDLGLFYRAPVENLSLAATVQNMGKMKRLDAEETNIPLIGRVGAAYQLPFLSSAVQATAVVDVVFPESEAAKIHVGGEMQLWRQIALRAGYMNGYESRNISFGCGFLRSTIRFDYAFIPFSDNLGSTHRFSVNFLL